MTDLVSDPRCKLRLLPGVEVLAQGAVWSVRVNAATELTLDDEPAALLMTDIAAAGAGVPAGVHGSAAGRLLALGIVGLECAVAPGGAPMARLWSLGYGQALRAGPPATAWQLHPRCTLATEGGGWRLAQPGSPFVLWLADLALAGRLARAGAAQPGLAAKDNAVSLLAQMAWAAGLIQTAGEADANPAWTDEDLSFHIASRRRNDHRRRGARAAAPAWAPPVTAPRRGLALDAALRARLAGFSFEQVLAARRSRRGEALPLGLHDLRDLLRVVQAECGNADTVRRAYPTAGGLLALEFHIVCGDVEGSLSGVYLFNTARGDFDLLAPPPGCAERLLDEAALSWGQVNGRPRALLVISARLPELAARYEATAYRLALLEAGGALLLAAQAAAALGLACCALGNGDGELFAQACGRSELDCPAVAEMAIGGRLAAPQR